MIFKISKIILYFRFKNLEFRNYNSKVKKVSDEKENPKCKNILWEKKSRREHLKRVSKQKFMEFKICSGNANSEMYFGKGFHKYFAIYTHSLRYFRHFKGVFSYFECRLGAVEIDKVLIKCRENLPLSGCFFIFISAQTFE